MKRVLLAAVLALSGCDSCRGEERHSSPSGPTMPSGMLVPFEAGAPPPAQPLAVARHVHGPAGEWVELQPAKPGEDPGRLPGVHWLDESLYVPVAALTGPLHECFARADPGFSLFLPQRFDPLALARLATELEVYARAAPPNDALGGIAQAVAAYSRNAAENGTALWISAP